ncbi:Lysosomal-trafficking regulator [Labeo rohita]|uniref:Lysosomal-trafficking regulator n=1 Tax=Labeo rohita TaxID=84645 RepID=A0ABQ8MDX6_LABRO|nr:Lysosomal-trafficking regulator [Labeo rohita]
MEAVGVAPEGAQLLASGLSTEVPPGSFVPPAPLWSIIDHSPPQDSTFPASPRPSIPLALSCSTFLSALPSSSVALAPPLSLLLHLGPLDPQCRPGSVFARLRVGLHHRCHCTCVITPLRHSTMAPPSSDSTVDLHPGWALVVRYSAYPPEVLHPVTPGCSLAPSSIIAFLVLLAPFCITSPLLHLSVLIFCHPFIHRIEEV